MVEPPCCRLSFESANQLEVSGDQSDRVRDIVDRWSDSTNWDRDLRCRIHIHQALRPHRGLGSGTQLALSVAAGLNRFLRIPAKGPDDLARSVSRARRSTVGTYGFFHGGLIYESGKSGPDGTSRLEHRVALPSSWRILLICRRRGQGMSGAGEQHAFGHVAPVPTDVSTSLKNEVACHLLPAAREGRFQDFSESVYRYGHRAGMCFSNVQGGPFSDAWQEQLIQRLRSWDLHGVGQSSWGPTVFAFTESQQMADDFSARLRDDPRTANTDITISRPNDCGARIEVLNASC